jgi:lipopolysaccharide export system permease protein
LLEYITYLQNNQQDSDRYQLALWRKIMQPLTIAVMLLVALSYVFGPLRSVTMGARVIMGVLTGFGFFIVDQVFGNMALVYQLPSIVGATLPACLFAGLAMFLLRR